MPQLGVHAHRLGRIKQACLGSAAAAHAHSCLVCLQATGMDAGMAGNWAQVGAAASQPMDLLV